MSRRPIHALFAAVLGLAALPAYATPERDCALAICEDRCRETLQPFLDACAFCDGTVPENCESETCQGSIGECIPYDDCLGVYEQFFVLQCQGENNQRSCIRDVLDNEEICDGNPVEALVTDAVATANAAYSAQFGGGDVVDDPAPIAADLQRALDELVGGGCLTIAEVTERASGWYSSTASVGVDEGGDLTGETLHRATRTFGFVRTDAVRVGSRSPGYSTYTGSRMLAETDATNGFLVGRWVRGMGSRGVWMGISGQCDADVDPLPILQSTWL